MAQVITMLSEHGLHPRSICEIGCGAGEVLKSIEKFTPEECQLAGFDINPAAAAHWESRRSRRLEFHVGDVLKTDRHFDVCLCLDVMEHIPDVHQFLQRLRPIANFHIFHIPLEMNAQMVMRGSLIRARQGAGHVHYFDKATALATLKENGFQVLDCRYSRSSITMGGTNYRVGTGWRTALLRLPRKLAAIVNEDLAARTLGGFSLLVLAQ